MGSALVMTIGEIFVMVFARLSHKLYNPLARLSYTSVQGLQEQSATNFTRYAREEKGRLYRTLKPPQTGTTWNCGNGRWRVVCKEVYHLVFH